MARRNPDSTASHDGDIEATDIPIVDEEGVPSQVLSLTIQADWGHFRRVDRTVTKQTYRIPPRTTISGLLAAICGVHRDGYYDVFTRDASAIAIQPLKEHRTLTVPSLGLGTNPDETMETAGGTGQKSVKVRYPDSTDNRQIHNYEVLSNPAYRVDVAVEDEEFYTALKTHLEAGTSYYPPSMGLSEYLASVEYHGEFEPEPVEFDGSVSIESVVPEIVDDIIPSADSTHRVERMPGFMEAHDGGRRTTAFTDYAFADSEPIIVNTTEAVPVKVDDRTVLFH
jgi:CRISPR-associated protein Cas5h